MKRSWLVVAPLALFHSSASIAATPSDTPPEKPISPFILCDGRTGHVGIGETLGRLVAITATAGLSEAAVKHDDATKRAKGLDGVHACDSAIATEGDDLRRAQLAMAKAIHLVEAGQLEDALATTGKISAIAGPLAQDSGFQRTFAPRIDLLEADILVRLKRPAEAEQAAIRALAAAPYDANLALHAADYLLLSPAMTPEKRAALDQLSRVWPNGLVFEASANVAAGTYQAADANLAMLIKDVALFDPDYPPGLELAQRATIAELNGDHDKASALATDAEKSLAKESATHGGTIGEVTWAARTSETLTLRKVLAQLVSGDSSGARAAFRAHGDWLLANAALVEAAIDRLSRNAPPGDRIGPLELSAAQYRAGRLDQRVSQMAQQATIDRLYGQAAYYSNRASFANASSQTWKIEPSPAMLVKKRAGDTRDYEVVRTKGSLNGFPAGEAVLLHSALIARSRGVDGFVLAPGRQMLVEAAVRFGNATDPAMPGAAMFNADTVIADLSRDIPMPPPTG